MKIVKGNKVKVEYEGKFDNGEIFDSSKHGEHSHPLEFVVGKGQVIPGFEEAVIGLKKGDEKEIKLESEEAYGNYDSTLKREIPKEVIPEGQEIKEGMIIVMQTPEGYKLPARIVSISDDSFTIDLNHPLAGKKLIFNIKVIDVEENNDQ